ncbi:hypothetical protein EMIHUDRAFT_454319 [Emiliania huxleyi CCMP1516]|uniref:Glucokinase n=2 Tax=Emiliania huxleyi TaxID=2903 RepID=A0A0D3KWM4_EMIH1|nr:hypothetical protein EMIHUDRAFT_460052 [Emiliania huxleyi CCMP1516]XP_005792588.1 hypothetical protein EMIHUDRAFT_454319 [Emiliania huxleyi CCMP1516]EOD07407.1 hypothetical protein EMIHUDRAFT_460052 [Emiliania huxleyi CCMP1516]EOD40159.1 hypothetical protein EMIHUDRAFT_454319 [Emiliania huxleyi CCMP1516]|eukprot:XP_005759836.1 hypothetical protein EMIHUDRAFT_460052 [Emiliania huxleyi CCMP1516]
MSGDCGGTNTRLTLFKVPASHKLEMGKPPPGEVIFSKKYLNSSHLNFTDVCKVFLKEAGDTVPATCCLACAGAISDNKVTFTNVKDGWTIDGALLEKELGIGRVKLINDFEAQGYGLLTLSQDEKVNLNGGVPKPGAPIACLGAGTGLGECYLTADASGRYTCFPSEGGHAEYAPIDDLTHDLRDWMMNKFLFTGDNKGRHKEDGASARAAFVDFRNEFVDLEFSEAPWHMQGAIVARGAKSGDIICRKARAVKIFTESYGSEAGVAALKWMPKGGLYISGGIAAKNPEWIKSEAFYDAYKNKGRLSPMVESVPLYLVLTEDTGERGALFVAVGMVA